MRIKMRIKLLTILIVVISISCDQQLKQKEGNAETVRPDVYANVIPELKACIEAHGGLEVWQSFGGLEYDRLSSSGASDHSIIDLLARKNLVKNDTTYTIGFDGTNVWITPDKEKMKSPRFFHNLYFYFFALPFVVADPGTNQAYMGEQNFDGSTYKKIKITYGDNVGDSPEDQYILWIDAQTNLLSFINYSVTYFDSSRAESYNAAVYREWEDIQGIKMPKVLSSYRWTADSLGEARGSNTFFNVRFSTQVPDQSLFEVSPGAIIDEGPVESE